ncbi:hypothetical protein NM688_g8517 [Phlebia brevispora]|uniref:Uncharacterized protein n=1 Tax=Phlebia brevispora TaxID=194682 RepID=A0ACC1RQI4_9APHY|nr:hypothetical protein NM688_g8517 [Phlebia brevispora]
MTVCLATNCSFIPASGSAATLEGTCSAASTSQNPNKMSTDSATGQRSRTLILCFDGTASQYDGDNTNVVKFYSLLKKDNTDEQLCYYQPGVGTYIEPGVVSPFFSWVAKLADEAVAWYLDAHVRGGYQFLMQNWRPNDKICIFGFSRGAYTARAVAGFVHKIGLLPKDNPEQIPMAMKLYKRTDAESIQLAAGFKQTFCRDVKIDFVGVWDTVASVGVLTSKTLPFTTSNTTIKVFRHALSLDEHRAKFRPNLYQRPPPQAEPSVSLQNAQQPASPAVASPTSFRPPESLRTSEDTRPLKQTPASETTAPTLKKPRFAFFSRNKRHQGKAGRKRLFAGRNIQYLPHHRELTNLNDPSDGDVGETDVKEVCRHPTAMDGARGRGSAVRYSIRQQRPGAPGHTR